MFGRLSMLSGGLFASRSHPDFDSLRAETDPERFVWAVLPLAARSFAASIVVLPRDDSDSAAVAYLYAAMLDAYEDLLPDEADRPDLLRAFAARFGQTPRELPPPIPETLARDERERLHLLLVEKAALVDAVFDRLNPRHRRAVLELITSMADGMAWASERFAEQGGVLEDDDQLFRYCHIVMGYPALFTIELLTGSRPRSVVDALAVSEMIQLANITRDIERDLARGVAYDPALRRHLGETTAPEVPAVRERLVGLALTRATAFRSLYDSVDLTRRPEVRLAAVLMLLFTDLHFRRMAARVGRAPWRGPRGKLMTVLVALPSVVSNRYSSSLVARIEGRFLAAAATSTPS